MPSTRRAPAGTARLGQTGGRPAGPRAPRPSAPRGALPFSVRAARAGSLALALAGSLVAFDVAAQEEEGGTGSPIVAADAPSTFAFNYGETETTRAAAMAGSMRAAGNGTTGVYMNPATMASTRVYHIEAQAQVTPEFGRHVYGGTIVDSVTSKLAGAFAVNGGFMDGDGVDRSWIDVRLGLAYPISDAFSVGFGGRYMKIVEDGLGPLGESKASGGLRDDGGGRFAMENLPTFDAGVAVRAGDILRIGVAGQNLSYPNHGLMPTTFGGGLAVATNDFTIEVDGVADFNSYEEIAARVMGGGEVLIADSVPIRLGYRFDQGAESHAISGGIGYLGREFSIEGAVRRTVVGPEATMMVFSVAYFLESSGLARAGNEL